MRDSRYRITLTLSMVDQDPLIKEIGMFHNKSHALTCYGKMVAIADLVCWKDDPWESMGSKMEKRKERNAKDK